MSTYRRLSVRLGPSGQVFREIQEAPLTELPEDDLLIKVAYSSLNYKDALSANGHKGISRFYPHTPGIDATGIVVHSKSSVFREGDAVIVTGYDLGMNTKGGFAEYVSVPATWALPLPEGMTPFESMMLGTAGLTAAMCIDKLLNHNLKDLPVLVSGATGGVGSIALLLLRKLGIASAAVSRRPEAIDYLQSLGASEVLQGLPSADKPLLSAKYSAAIDTVGGETLENALKQIDSEGGMAICGMAAASHFHSSVFPFILRGVTLYGIGSAESALAWKKELWQKLAWEWKPEGLATISRAVRLEELEVEIQQMLAGRSLGRVVVAL